MGVVHLILSAALATALVACTDPCASLARRTCARGGQSSAVCKQLSAIAAAPQSGDRQACEAGVAFIDELEKR